MNQLRGWRRANVLPDNYSPIEELTVCGFTRYCSKSILVSTPTIIFYSCTFEMNWRVCKWWAFYSRSYQRVWHSQVIFTCVHNINNKQRLEDKNERSGTEWSIRLMSWKEMKRKISVPDYRYINFFQKRRPRVFQTLVSLHVEGHLY